MGRIFISRGAVLFFLFVVWNSGLSAVSGATDEEIKADKFLYGTFPEGFKWGLATSAYQIEGGWDADGKGVSIWDFHSHKTLSPIIDRSNGDIACDSYHKYEEDVQLLKNMGSDFYRFSIAWTRILPDGTIAGGTNQPGIDYYNNLINLLLENNIQPMVTIYHWDLPQSLQELGGWPDEVVIDHYADFARLLFELFGDRVKHWITFNEPYNTCVLGYGVAVAAPGVFQPVNTPYLCAHTILKSHAKVYRIYEREFKSIQNGKCGIVIDSSWYEPANTTDPEHIEAAERAIQFKHGWFASPIFFGKYPDVMREFVDRASPPGASRLPTFDAHWTNEINGSWDFLGLNHYTTELTAPQQFTFPGWAGDQKTSTFKNETWPTAASFWLASVPWGFRKLLNWIKVTYDNPEIIVTENGYSDKQSDGLNDIGRQEYFISYINNMLKAVNEDGVNVTGYTAWSLLDNFEWAMGYLDRFGLHWVNFTDANRPRLAKDSVAVLTKIFSQNGFPIPESEFDTTTETENDISTESAANNNCVYFSSFVLWATTILLTLLAY